MAVKTYNAGVKEYRQTYWTPDYTPLDTDILACFKITPQAGVPREEVAAAVAADGPVRDPARSVAAGQGRRGTGAAAARVTAHRDGPSHICRNRCR